MPQEKLYLQQYFCLDSKMDAEQAGAFVLPVFAIPVENLRELAALSLLLGLSVGCLVPREGGHVGDERNQ